MQGFNADFVILDEIADWDDVMAEHGDVIRRLLDPAPIIEHTRPIIDEYGNIVGSERMTNPACKECGDPHDHDGRPHSEAVHADREAFRQLQHSFPPEAERPLLAVRMEPVVGHRVMVAWGEARGMVGVITGKRDGGYFIRKSEGPGASGLYIGDAIRVILDAPPAFDDRDEAEDWLHRSGEQEWFPGDEVRVSERRDRDAGIQYAKIVKYLGITGIEPPKYLILMHGEPKIVASYFIKGLANQPQTRPQPEVRTF